MDRQRAHIYEYDVIHAVLYDGYNTCGVHSYIHTLAVHPLMVTYVHIMCL